MIRKLAVVVAVGAAPVIHSQLLADCHRLGRFDVCHVLLNRNAALAWFILVPQTEIEDVLALPARQLQQVMGECQRIDSFLRQTLGYTKTNFAGLGNVVPQMHLHIIGRAPDDACWPAPVWGNLEAGPAYAEDTLVNWVAALDTDYGLVADEQRD